MDTITNLFRKKTLLDSYKPFPSDSVKNLEEWYRVELTYTSNALEGNTLTRQETSLIVDKGITIEGKSLQEHQEAINHAEAFTYIHQLAQTKKRNEITVQDILDIHRFILKNLDDPNAGRLRNVPVRIAGSTTILPNPLKVVDLMGEFISWLQTTNESIVQIASDAHFKLVSIHPFVDGNGRTARLLMNLLLMQAGFPPAIIKKEERNRYLTALEVGQTTNNTDAYHELIYDAINRSLDMYLETLAPQQQNPLDKTFYTASEVAKFLQVDPESVRRYVRNGQLKAVKLGGRLIRIEKADLDTFITHHKK